MESTFCIPDDSKMSCKFVVDKFSSREGNEPIDSQDTIYMPNVAEFDLVLYPNSDDFCGTSNSAIIYVSNFDIQTTEKVAFRCAISILNKNEEKCYTREGQLVIKDSKIESNWSSFISRDYLMDPANGLLPNDTLKIVCEMSLMNQPESKLPLEIVQQKHNTIQCDIQSLFHSKKCSDIVLVSGVAEFSAHKSILSARSPVFGAMFEHECEEKKQNRVVITDIEAEVLAELLRYIYTGTVSSLDKYSDDLLVAADKYQMDSLKSICEQSLSRGLTIESAMKLLVLSDMHNASKLKANCFEYIASHPTQVTTQLYNAVISARPELGFELFNALAHKK